MLIDDPEYLPPDKDPIICKFFGCGEPLSFHEALFGDYCAAHQHPQNRKEKLTAHEIALLYCGRV